MTSREEQFQTDLLEWGDQNTREYPWREQDRSFYEVFIAEFFLTQTPADNVASVYPVFLEQFPSLKAIEEASEDELINVIEPLGFYNLRAKAMKSIATQYEQLPENTGTLMELPRVGQYVANATLCFAQDQPLPILDRNVERIYGRVFRERWPQTPAERLRFAEQLVPNDAARPYNLALLDFGAAICKSEPLCEVCFASEYCSYYAQTGSAASK